ncbi:putative mitochondrial protein [Labeo rohita]|uniref:Mitochondrial protein n=1 Tax=Labeo rohita TaxID=84645 RepID=A0ABQ8MNN4_LABRO|nr:putative mitochondrial protein [Labeo rohita]
MRLNEAGLKPGQTLKFLVHTISKEGLHPDPAPHDLASLCSFLGLTSLDTKFLLDYTTVVEPLHGVLRTATYMNFLWTDEAEQSFATLKKLLSQSPSLALFDPRLPTYTSIDASGYGVGEVLSQLHTDGTECIVSISPAKRKYSTAQGELACESLCGQPACYAVLLGVAFHPGKYNMTADCLSRPPLPDTGDPTDGCHCVALALSVSDSADLRGGPRGREVVIWIFRAPQTYRPALVSEFTSASESCSPLAQLGAQTENGWPKNKSFGATAHATTGATPYELLRGRAKLNVLPVSRCEDTIPKVHWLKRRAGPNTFLLDEGKKWNTPRLAGVPNEVLISLEKKLQKGNQPYSL